MMYLKVSLPLICQAFHHIWLLGMSPYMGQEAIVLRICLDHQCNHNYIIMLKVMGGD
jgi:hypothetical protein